MYGLARTRPICLVFFPKFLPRETVSYTHLVVDADRAVVRGDDYRVSAFREQAQQCRKDIVIELSSRVLVEVAIIREAITIPAEAKS